MPSNLSADERAAVAHLKVMLANFAALAADTLNPAMRQVYERNATAIETVLAVVARAGEPVADASKNIAIANRLTVFARELGRDHPRYITLLNAAIALEMSAIAHPADARAGEPVAWVVEFKRDDESEWRKSGPHLDYAEAERDQTRLLLRHWPAHILSLYAHPADARDRGDAGEAVSAAELAHMFAMGMTRNVAIDLSQPIRLTHDKVESAMRYVAHALKSRAVIDHAMPAAPAAPEVK